MSAGLRERNKLDKDRRIRSAAKAVFRKKGYPQATMREIAERAGVGTGTLFLYARDKRDLFLNIVNDDLDRLTAAELEQIDPQAELVDQLILLHGSRYEYWARDRVLALHALQEVNLTPPGNAVDVRRWTLEAHTVDLVARQQQRGNLRGDESAEHIGKLLHFVYLSAIRAWLRLPDETVGTGLAELRGLFRLALRGVTT